MIRNEENPLEFPQEIPSYPSIDFFTTAPQLQSLEVNKHGNIMMHSFRVPWSQLTRLYFHFFDVDQLEWFKETTDLKSCKSGSKLVCMPLRLQKEHVMLFNLHTLHLRMDSTLDLSQFQHIIVPTLVELQISACDGQLVFTKLLLPSFISPDALQRSSTYIACQRSASQC